jgi:hypothetical protein
MKITEKAKLDKKTMQHLNSIRNLIDEMTEAKGVGFDLRIATGPAFAYDKFTKKIHKTGPFYSIHIGKLALGPVLSDKEAEKAKLDFIKAATFKTAAVSKKKGK